MKTTIQIVCGLGAPYNNRSGIIWNIDSLKMKLSREAEIEIEELRKGHFKTPSGECQDYFLIVRQEAEKLLEKIKKSHQGKEVILLVDRDFAHMFTSLFFGWGPIQTIKNRKYPAPNSSLFWEMGVAE